jgi:hypothetical protein
MKQRHGLVAISLSVKGRMHTNWNLPAMMYGENQVKLGKEQHVNGGSLCAQQCSHHECSEILPQQEHLLEQLRGCALPSTYQGW